MSALGIDVGTSAVKAARFAPDGRLLAAARAPLPPLRLCGDEATQALGPIESAVDRVARELTRGDPPDFVALTVQRDTALALDERGRPLTELVSWRDTRHVRAGSLWAALSFEPGLVRVRSLASHLVERWTGRAAETDATRPHHLDADALEAIEARGAEVDVPDTIAVGGRVGHVATDAVLPAGTPVHLTAGDKNVEFLGAGVTTTGLAGLSLGSAISLGIAVEGARPAARPGTVVTRAALHGVWNVETGLIAGTTVLDRLRALARNAELAPDDAWRDDLWCVPLPAGALDDAAATGVLAGLRESTSPADLARAWAQGVACELAHLLPLLVEGRAPLEDVRVCGGGANAAWAMLLADVLRVPARVVDDTACGPRGAVLCVHLHAGDVAGATALRRTAPSSPKFEPDPARRAAVMRYRDRWDRLRAAAVSP